MAFAEDLAPFFADFGITATVGGVSVRGIFDSDYQDAFGLASGSTSSLLVAGSVAVAVNAAVVVPAGSFKVLEIREENGMKRLMLRKA